MSRIIDDTFYVSALDMYKLGRSKAFERYRSAVANAKAHAQSFLSNAKKYSWGDSNENAFTNNDFSFWSARTKAMICKNDTCTASKHPFAERAYQKFLDIRRFYYQRFKYNPTTGSRNDPGRVVADLPGEQAYWSPNRENFGFSNDFRSKIVLAHEFTHSIISTETKLSDYDQAGALNESLADVMAIIFSHYMRGQRLHRQSESSSWQVPLARTKDENNHWQTTDCRDLAKTVSMQDFIRAVFPQENSRADYGHVHENSRMPSHAFYLSVKNLERDYPSHGVIGSVWFNTMLDLQREETFSSFAHSTIAQAELCPDRNVKAAIVKAWEGVGVIPKDYEEAKREWWRDLEKRLTLGLAVEELNPRPYDGGLKVTKVQPGSPAAKAGFKPGMILKNISRVSSGPRKLWTTHELFDYMEREIKAIITADPKGTRGVKRLFRLSVAENNNTTTRNLLF